MMEEIDTGATVIGSSTSPRRCDESKCLSTGLMPTDGGADAVTSDNPLLFNCYARGPGTLYPYLCAEDYIGVRITDYDVSATDYDVFASTDTDIHYYTCCTPDENETPTDDEDKNSSPVRECNDPQEVDQTVACSGTWNPSEACQSDTPSHPYTRFMTTEAGFPLGYMCCNVDDSPPMPPPMTGSPIYDYSIEGTESGTTTSILLDSSVPSNGEIDVVGNVMPGQGLDGNKNTSVSATVIDDKLLAEIGCFSRSAPKECHSALFCGSCTAQDRFLDPEEMICYNNEFRYPHVTMMNGNSATYSCCSFPQENSSDYMNSPAYLATIWLQFSLALFASLMACLAIVSIGRSLYLARKSPNETTIRRRNNGSDFSSYSFYLILLAIPDLLYNLYMLFIVADAFDNGWNPYTDCFITMCAVINQSVNVVIAREVYLLSLKTKNCQRYTPPNLKKASIQFGIVTTYAAALGGLWLWLLNFSTDESIGNTVRPTVAIPMKWVTLSIFFTVVAIVPAIYLIWVCSEIWRKDLLPKNQVTIGQTLRFHTTTVETQPQSQSSLKNLLFSFRKSPNSDSRDNTCTTASSNRPDSNPVSTNGVSAIRNPNHEGTTTTRTDGRMNMLAIYFLRIILVFFFVWFPGMVMYYYRFEPNHNQAGRLHNIALIFFSLQAIVSNGMALTKPDVKKSTCQLWHEVRSLCCYCYNPEQIEEGHDNATTPTALASSKKGPEKWPDGEEGDIEVPIRGEPIVVPEKLPLKQVASKRAVPPVSNFVTVHHQITNIGGVQVSQLTTHTISSFNSSSHVQDGEKGESDSDDENDEGLEFGCVPPAPSAPPPRNPSIPRFLVLDSDRSLSRHEKDSKSEKKKKKKSKMEKQSSDGWISGGSSGGRASLRKGDRSNHGSVTASPASSKRKKKRLSGSHITDSPSGPPKRRNSRSGSSKGKSPSSQTRMKKRLSGSHRYGSDSSSHGKPMVSTRRNSLTGLTGMPMNRSPTSQSKKNRFSSSNLNVDDAPIRKPQRKNSRTDSKKLKSPKSQSRKKQLSASKIAGGDRPAGEAINTIGSNEELRKSPVTESKKLKSPVQKSKKSSKSPSRSRRKKLDGSGKHISEPPLAQENTKKIKTTSSHARNSPRSQSKKKRAGGNVGNNSYVKKIVDQIESPRLQEQKRLSDNGSSSHVGDDLRQYMEKKLSDDKIEMVLGASNDIVSANNESPKKQVEDRISGTGNNISGSPELSRKKKRISNSKGISYDGAVFDHC